MTNRAWLTGSATLALLVVVVILAPAPACCPVAPLGKPVVNADQTVVLLWDAATKTEHFIRQASFKSDANDFGFVVPSPTQPELSESGNEAFPLLKKITEPEVKQLPRPPAGIGCGCASSAPTPTATLDAGHTRSVTVLEEKLVAGFNAVVLESKSTESLVTWLKDHGYAFSPEVAAWAKPYVESGWKFTALKVARSTTDHGSKDVGASALRISFHTDRPLFPYREPDPKNYAAALDAKHRLLRIYFIAEARYGGELTKNIPWTGQVAWSNPLTDKDRNSLLERLKLPQSTGPTEWWLTEFEDDWPYRAAPADVYFSVDANQHTVKRPPIIVYVRATLPDDVSGYALAAALVLPPLWRRVRGSRPK
jgi:hypothetical protein